MLYWTEYEKHEYRNVKRYNKKYYDDTIYTFDIETSSYFECDNVIHPASEYDKYKDRDLEYLSCMYVWQFSVDDHVFYGRTWEELKDFFDLIDHDKDTVKIVYVHNLSFEFQFLWSHFEMLEVFARKSRKVLYCSLADYSIEFRCSLFLTNASLEYLPDIFNLDVKKQTGKLDYKLLRHNQTPLTEDEKLYCEYDCLVLYEVIRYYHDIYGHCYRIPRTNTGIVRKAFQKHVRKNDSYKHKILKCYNDDPVIYTMLVKAFAGGYTHANYIHAGDIVDNVTSYDEASAYPYHMIARRYPARKFRKCFVKDLNRLLTGFAYLMKITLKNVKSRYFNHFISYSKCYDCYNIVLDNGRIITADQITLYCTDVDIKLYMDCYDFDYQIDEIYYSTYEYLPIELIQFLLQLYGEKTILKGSGAEYSIKKGQFNSMYGMCVTNNIRDKVDFDNGVWTENALSNDEIIEMLQKERKKAFLSFAWGVWITAYSRDTLCRQIMNYDDQTVYCDTDSIKLKEGYDPVYIDNYNKSVHALIENISSKRNIDIDLFYPKDKKGKAHCLGLFENEGTYKQFVTLGAKKYCYTDDIGLHITVSGVPKKTGASCLTDISEFKKGFVFHNEKTGKLAACYNDDMKEHFLTDYLGNCCKIDSRSGVTFIGSDYTLGITIEYDELISSNRALYKESD